MNRKWRKDSLFNNWYWKNWTTIGKIKLEHSLIPYTKVNSKWIKDLNVKPEIIKLLEKNLCRTLFNTNFSSIFWIWLFKAREIKAQMTKLGLIKLKSFCTAKEISNEIKRQSTEWGEAICE